MRKVYIVGAKRTPLGSFGGSLANTPAAELGGICIKAALEQANLQGENVDEVIVGNVLSSGQGMGPGRQASRFAGIPDTTPAYTLNMVCGSSLKTVMDGTAKIRTGDAEVIVAAGMENMSRAPFILPAQNRFGSKMGHQTLSDSILSDGLTDVFNQYHMGMTAENIVAKHGLTREQQDAFALRSQQRAVTAIQEGAFEEEIVPVSISYKRKEILFSEDEYPRADTSAEKLGGLRPAFRKDGSVTAGNASGINDGGVALVLASEEVVERLNLSPLAEVVTYGQGGVDPSFMGLGPVPAIEQALSRADLTLDQIELLELNEAFAAQALGVMKELSEIYDVSQDWLNKHTNLWGGAIALGHPLGASGGRILTTLLYGMKRRSNTYGLASLCIGGGMGVAVVLKQIHV